MKQEEGKKLARDYYNQEANEYILQYRDTYKKYPFNLVRLNTVIGRFKKNNVKTVLDMGCGTAGPLIKMLQEGFDVYGLDFAPEMIEKGKEELIKANFDPERIWVSDLETTMPKKGLPKYDAIIALGVFPHLLNEKAALHRMKNLLNVDGKTYISFRNKLFASFTFNEYSQDLFLNDMINISALPEDLRSKANDFFKDKCNVSTIKKDDRITYNDILAKLHNPLTIEQDLYELCGFEVDKKLFYHYHALPPKLSEGNEELFNDISFKLEDPEDWRGLFMASAFVVEAKIK